MPGVATIAAAYIAPIGDLGTSSGRRVGDIHASIKRPPLDDHIYNKTVDDSDRTAAAAQAEFRFVFFFWRSLLNSAEVLCNC